MTRPRLALTIAGLTALAAGALAAAPLPYAKPGLWVIAQHSGTGRTYTTKLCSDKATQASMLNMGNGMTAQMCSKQDMTANGNQVQIDAVCHMGPTTITSRTVVTYAGDSAFQVVNDGTFSPAFMGKTTSHTTMDAKWSGACPAGMAPGDMVGPTGMRMRFTGGSVVPAGH